MTKETTTTLAPWRQCPDRLRLLLVVSPARIAPSRPDDVDGRVPQRHADVDRRPRLFGRWRRWWRVVVVLLELLPTATNSAASSRRRKTSTTITGPCWFRCGVLLLDVGCYVVGCGLPDGVVLFLIEWHWILYIYIYIYNCDRQYMYILQSWNLFFVCVWRPSSCTCSFYFSMFIVRILLSSKQNY